MTKPGRILVVDDNEMNRDMLSRRLSRIGHNVQMAPDGESALVLIEREPFDVVLLDVMMPGIDGFQVLERIRAQRSPTQLPVIMATAKDQSGDIVQALQMGANDYVTKPLDFPVVQARVQTQISLKRSVEQIVALERDVAQKNERLQAANARMRRELEAAARIQQSLLPTETPWVPGARFAWAYRPCQELAGDILNVFRLDDSHVGLYLLDVSGHGVAAALLSVTLSRLLTPSVDGGSPLRRRLADGSRIEIAAPAEVVEVLNRQFPMDLENGQYFTLVYGVYNWRTGELSYVRAGHPPPLRVRRTGDATRLDVPGTPVGMFEDMRYEEARLMLEPGDRVYIFSDGLSEAMDARREQFGEERILESFRAETSTPLSLSVQGLVRRIEDWSGPSGPHDDVSLLAFERLTG